MTDGGGGVSSGGVLGPVDWSYSSPHFNSKDFLHNDSYYDDGEDDDDLDSYYMDLPPIDMTERLKEVNRALAEDETPVESSRTTKLRFREVIAEFQSPRESVIVSDSDDGYGDSSDIMFDAEEENEIIACPTQTSLKNLMSGNENVLIKTSHDLHDHQPSVTVPRSNVESSSYKTNYDITDHSSNIQVSSNCSSIIKSNVIEEVKPILKQDLENSNCVEEIPEIIEELPFPGNGNDLTNDDVFLPSPNSAVSSTPDNKKEEGKSFSKSNGRFSKCYNKSELEDLVSDIDEEIEEFNNELFFTNVSDEEVSSKETSPLEKDDPSSTNFFSKFKHKTQLSQNLGMINNKNSITIGISPSLPKGFNNDSNCKLEKNEKENVIRESVRSKLAKKSLEIQSSETNKTVKSRDSRLSSSQPIPNIKSNLMTPVTYQPLKFKLGVPVTSNSMRRSRSQTVLPSSSNSQAPLANSIQSTRLQSSRKGSPLPKRRLNTNDKVPMKAIHDKSFVPSKVSSEYGRSTFKPLTKGVRKAASTSDLRRTGGLEENRKFNDETYEKWLNEKRKALTLTKRQQEEAKEAEEAAAAVKLKERKKMAEEAFQQWLRRKREQLRAEKRLRSHRRKLDQHSSYARTRIQCEEAYTEWSKRKQEEISQRRKNGVNVRSRSLERNWIQEKTRKLYNAYTTKR